MAVKRKTLLITGASRGIGAATARLAAARGWDVIINYVRDAGAAEQVVADCRAAGAEAFAVQADTARDDDIARLFETARARVGFLDGLVNNAGITGLSGRLEDASPATIREVTDLNVTGALLVARAAIPLMSTRRGGRGGAMVNISSGAATLGSPDMYVWYAASKGAINTMTTGLALELAPDDIRVNGVAPGLIETDIHAQSGVPDRLAKLLPTVPLKRIGRPEEIAESVLFLLSDAASYITGQTLRVAGGR